MYEVTNTTAAPYASVVYIRSTWSNGTASRASGVIVGENDVLTALHVVYDPTLGWATSVTVIPGTDTSPYFTDPFGTFSNVGSMVGRTSSWDLDGDGLLTQFESSGDLALLGLTTRIGDVTGWLPVSSSATSDFNGVMVGYPARGTGMMAEGVTAHASQNWSVYDIDSALGPGGSGGPLIDTINGVPTVVGVLSSGNSSETLSTYAGLDSAATMDWLRAAMAANDTLIGLPPGSAPLTSPSIIMGTSAADTLTGTPGADVFNGLGGNDTIDGGSGLDSAIYSGPRASYAVTQLSSGALQVRDTVLSRDGTDTLANVERLHFSDGWLAFDVNGSAGTAFGLYAVALGRTPDAAGLGFHIQLLDNGTPVIALANEFIASPEFQSKYGALDNTAFVKLLYQNALHRAADAGGLAFYVGNLDHGIGTRANVVADFVQSAESHSLLMGVMLQGMAFT